MSLLLNDIGTDIYSPPREAGSSMHGREYRYLAPKHPVRQHGTDYLQIDVDA